MIHEQLISQVRAAFEDGASAESRTAAAQACRMLLSVLEPGAATQSPPNATPRPAAPADPLGLVLDAFIAKHAHLLPADRPKSHGLDIPIIPLPTSIKTPR